MPAGSSAAGCHGVCDTVLTQNRASLLQPTVSMCIDRARRSFSFRQQSQLLRAEAAAAPQDRDQAGATTGRFHALVAALPVTIATYSSGSNGMRTRLALPVRDATTTPCRSMVSTIALALARSPSTATVTSRRSLLYRSGWAVLTS